MNTQFLAPLAYSPDEAAKVTTLSRARIYELLASGRIPSRKEGRRRLIPADALRAFVNGEESTDARAA